MPKDTPDIKEASLGTPAEYKIKTLKQCTCGATRFQGPNPIGEIVNGKFVVIEEVFTCRTCHKQYNGTADKMYNERVVDVTGS